MAYIGGSATDSESEYEMENGDDESGAEPMAEYFRKESEGPRVHGKMTFKKVEPASKMENRKRKMEPAAESESDAEEAGEDRELEPPPAKKKKKEQKPPKPVAKVEPSKRSPPGEPKPVAKVRPIKRSQPDDEATPAVAEGLVLASEPQPIKEEERPKKRAVRAKPQPKKVVEQQLSPYCGQCGEERRIK